MSDQHNFYTVQKILARKRTKQGSFCYKIKWKDWPISTSTWQPLQHLEYVKSLIKKYDRFCETKSRKNQISRRRRQEEHQDDDKAQQNLTKKEGKVGGKKSSNESKIRKNTAHNKNKTYDQKYIDSLFQDLKNVRKKQSILQNQLTRNSITTPDLTLDKKSKLKKRIIKSSRKREKQEVDKKTKVTKSKRKYNTKVRTRSGKSIRIQQSDDNQISDRKKKNRKQKIQNNIKRVENIIRNKRKRIKKTVKRGSNIAKDLINDQRQKIRRPRKQKQLIVKNKKEIKNRRRGTKLLQKYNKQQEDQEIQQQEQIKKSITKRGRKNNNSRRQKKLQNKAQKPKRRRQRKYERPGRPKIILTEQQLQLKKQKLKQKRRDYFRLLKARKKDEQNKIVNNKRRTHAQSSKISQKHIIIPIVKRGQFSKKKVIDLDSQKSYKGMVEKSYMVQEEQQKVKKQEQWYQGQNIGQHESNYKYQKQPNEKELRSIYQDEQDYPVLQQQSSYRMPMYAPLEQYNQQNQGKLQLSEQSYPKLQDNQRRKSRNRRSKKPIHKVNVRQVPKRRKKRSFAELFIYQRSKQLNRIPRQVLQQSLGPIIRPRQKQVQVIQRQQSCSQQIEQKISLKQQLFNFNPKQSFNTPTVYQDNKLYVQFIDQNDEKCLIEANQLANYCGEWLKTFYESYI